jgi:serine protease Do
MCAAASAALMLAASPAATQSRAPSAADVSGSLESTARQASPAVVQIFATSFAAGAGLVPRNADLVRTERASGSGVIVSPDGFIVTNAHVVRGARRLTIELPVAPSGESILAVRSRAVEGRLVGLDLETDLAVVKVEAKGLPALAFGDSDELRPGQLVLALGSPLGLDNSVSLGIVSAVARQLEPESPMIYVQTDASINPGSSGGPLVDLQGRVMGINTLNVSQAGGNDGLGFAAPSNIVRAVYEQLRATGRVRRGDIGVRPQTVTPVLAAGLALPRDRGVVLADVLPGSPAQRAGLRPGDIILTLDGKPMENGRQFQVGLYRHLAGDIVSLDVLRGGDTLRMRVTMAERREPMDGVAAAVDPRQNLVGRLGILGVTLDKRLTAMIPVVRVPTGVVVASMVPGAIESRDGGLAPGDVIYAVNTVPVEGLDGLRKAIDGLQSGQPVVLQLERRGELLYLAFVFD